MNEITIEDFTAILTGDPEELDVHLELVERDMEINGKKIKVHCHCLVRDGNNRVKVRRLAEFMRNSIADYAIPRSKLEAARKRDLKYNSSAAVSAIHNQACSTFTDLKNTGEGGEMLLFLLAERFLRLPHVLCKMDLKTDSQMHYHGADGVYAGLSETGTLKVYWGESKIYKDPKAAIRDCLRSLAPFLIEEEHEGAGRERDLILLSDKADLSDPDLTAAFKKYFDRSSLMSNRVEYCGIALIGFDAQIYENEGSGEIAKTISDRAREQVRELLNNVEARTIAEKLDRFEIQFLCVPFPSVKDFRAAFLGSLGHTK